MFALALICTAFAAWLLAGAVCKAPAAFYALAVVVDAVYVAGAVGAVQLPSAAWAALIFLVQKCSIALALFTVVMFIGVLPPQSRAGVRMRAARAGLSIVACVLALGHVAAYLAPFAARVLSGGGSANVAASFSIALAMLVLMALLGITSLEFVRRRMKGDSWKRIQRLAYVFFGLTYAHLALMLLPSAMAGGAAAMRSMAVYTVVFLAYAAARVVRWRIDAGAPRQRAAGFDRPLAGEDREETT